MTRLLPIVALLGSCASPSPVFESPEHDFAAQALGTPHQEAPATTPAQRPELERLVAAARDRFSATRELDGLLDSAARRALAATPWRSHPELGAKRAALSAALEEYGQARELEDLLGNYRALQQPGSPEPPVVSPHTESLRGRMADHAAASAWHALRAALVRRAAAIFEARSSLTLCEARVRISADHLKLVDELVPVVRARIGTGRSRQADLLSLRSERAAVAARLEKFRSLREAHTQELREAANTPDDVAIPLPPLRDELPDFASLALIADAHAPALQGLRADLARRRTALRLAELIASDAPKAPGGGVRAAIRRELRERITALERTVTAQSRAVGTEVARARAHLVGTRAEESALATRSVPDARSALANLRAGYAGRRVTFLDVFRAAKRRLVVELDLARARHERTRAEMSLFRAIGRRTP